MITWSALVEGDEVLSRNGKWYRVRAVAALDGGRVRVAFEGVAKSFIKASTEPAGDVRRGDSGRAADILVEAFGATVISSGAGGRA